MYKSVICYSVFVSFVLSNVLQIPENIKHHINKNETKKIILDKNRPINKIKLDNTTKHDQQFKEVSNNTDTEIEDKKAKTKFSDSKIKYSGHYYNKALESIPILQKIHARITRSKDAVWATVTLTFICVLLVLAVAQSRMWKEHYYTESQGVPLPNFNERVLFKDVMERKISTMKKFFKNKKSKEKDVTELESLLPPSEWDN